MADETAFARPLAATLFGVVMLSTGIVQGLVTVTLGHTLAHRGFSTAEIAGLVSLYLLPAALRFLLGPLVDLILGPRAWSLIAIVASSASAAVFAFIPLDRADAPLLAANVFVLAVASNMIFTAVAAVMAVTTPDRQRGAVSAWMNTGYLGGIGLGGGFGLWLATHAGGISVAALVIAGLTLSCAWPLAIVRTTETPAHASLKAHFVGLGRAIADLGATRAGVLALIAVTIPTGIGAALNLMPAVADHWRASADLVAAVSGVFGGLASVPGAIIGGYLSDRFPRRSFFIATGLLCAAAEAALALAPHTPMAFAVLVPFNALVIGVTYSAVSTVMFERLGAAGAATVVAILGSLANVPLVAMTIFVGAVETAHGATAMLAAEAGVGVAAALLYAALAWLCRPSPTAAARPVPAA